MAVGEVIFGPFCKKNMHIKIQMYLSVVFLCLFCGVMYLGNEFRQSLAIAVSLPFSGLASSWLHQTTPSMSHRLMCVGLD